VQSPVSVEEGASVVTSAIFCVQHERIVKLTNKSCCQSTKKGPFLTPAPHFNIEGYPGKWMLPGCIAVRSLKRLKSVTLNVRMWPTEWTYMDAANLASCT
jgi:hypothetical protein